ncbi:Aste57867_15457 [Aphanomyces stellatus]|uniref:Aste57867_15457 protein n=1 Tax=Aphanomyces stellatus TaxID=120398 RepID=A0A485L366_9STRA|nr:hypothetical protein As57867_015401 [Aphanomyces stellatus]VFT92259.1 Aste57867_15457 [Aphanomyces stellatus]
MVTWGQVGFTMIAAGYLIGRKELPRLATMGGRYVGRSIGALLRAKNEYYEATKSSEIVKMQQELQKGLDELNQIRSEMSMIGTMKRPYAPVSTPANHPSAHHATPMKAASEAPTAVAAASGSSFVRPAATTPVSSLPLGSSSLHEYTDERSFEELIHSADDQEQARLALAEINMAKEQKFASRIESIEGGADYVAASLMESILLERRHHERPPTK